jgi:hypothetical protein
MMSWLEAVSWISIVLGFVTAVMCIDLVQRPQKMRIMNIVWPVTGLYFPLIGLWFYKSVGQPMAADAPAMKGKWPYWKLIFLSATHCGSAFRGGNVRLDGDRTPHAASLHPRPDSTVFWL